jgi:hypothetical protein
VEGKEMKEEEVKKIITSGFEEVKKHTNNLLKELDCYSTESHVSPDNRVMFEKAEMQVYNALQTLKEIKLELR